MAKRRGYNRKSNVAPIPDPPVSTFVIPDRPFWITRDSDEDGTCDDECDVWSASPTRLRRAVDDKGAFWVCGKPDAPIGTLMDARIRTCTVKEAIRLCGTYPESDRESIMVS